MGQNGIPIHIDVVHAFFLEVFGTMFLILTILATIDESKGHAPSYLQPLAIGIAILVMHIFLVSQFFILIVDFSLSRLLVMCNDITWINFDTNNYKILPTK